MLRQYFLLSILLFSTFVLLAQKKAPKTWEVGVFLGRSYYLGELNPKTHMGNGVGSFAFGGLVKYNLNRRYSLRAGVNFGNLNADDGNVDLPFNQFRKASFDASIVEGHALLEFNFLPYELGNPQFRFSPYLFVGPSFYSYEVNFHQESLSEGDLNRESQITEEESNIELAIPFGLGFKLNLTKRIGLSFEWGFRKANDRVDGLPNLLNEKFENGKDYDKDWYSFSGFLLTYKISKTGPCPAI